MRFQARLKFRGFSSVWTKKAFSSRFIVLEVDLPFDITEHSHHLLEWWWRGKEHLVHLSVVLLQFLSPALRRKKFEAARDRQIVPGSGRSEEDGLVFGYTLVELGEVVIMPGLAFRKFLVRRKIMERSTSSEKRSMAW